MSSHTQDRARVIPLPPRGARDAQAGDAQAGDSQAGDSQVRDGEPQVRDREPLWRHIVGDVLRQQRLAQERKLKDVAEAARISMPYLSEIERGRKEASSEVLAAAAHALGLGLADLLGLAQQELTRIAQARQVRLGTPQVTRLSTPPGGLGTPPVSRLGTPQVTMSLAA